MRYIGINILFAAGILAGCDVSTSPTVAALPGNTVNSSSLVISPSVVQVQAGTILQFTTNASAADQNAVQWSSSNSTVATISPTGVVQTLVAGTSTIRARLSTDTTQSATASLTVTSP